MNIQEHKNARLEREEARDEAVQKRLRQIEAQYDIDLSNIKRSELPILLRELIQELHKIQRIYDELLPDASGVEHFTV